MTDTIADPFAQQANTDDPFATADDVKGGGGPFTPAPSMDAINGRLVAMIPRSFRDDAPIPDGYIQEGGKTVRDQWTVDLYVLDGGELRYWYNAKQEGSEIRVPTEHVIPANGIPAEFKGVWRVESAIIGQLNKVNGTPRPILLGVAKRGPQAKDRDKGATFATVAEQFKAWEQRGKPGNGPRFSWQIDVNTTPAQRDAALAWWRSAGITL